MKVRIARDSDLQRIAEIGVKSFPRKTVTVQSRLERLLNETRHGPGDILVCEEEKNIVGCASLIPQRTWLGGDEYESGGVASVAVEPHYRRRGVARALMDAALAQLRSRGVAFSMLYPFNYTFYKSYGYGLVGQTVEFNFAAAHLPSFPEARRVCSVTMKDKGDLLKFYDRWLPTQNLRLHRNPRRWEHILFRDNNQFYMFKNAKGAVEGYLCFKYERSEETKATTIAVGDFVAASAEARRALIGFISAQSDQVAAVQLVQPLGAPLPHLLAEPRGAKFPWGESAVGRVHSSFMLKILVPEKCFSGKRNFNGHSGTLAITLTPSSRDPEPERSFAVRFSRGIASVAKSKVRSKVSLKTSVADFASLITGTLRVSDACALGLAQVDDPKTAAALDRAFETAPPFQPQVDYF